MFGTPAVRLVGVVLATYTARFPVGAVLGSMFRKGHDFQILNPVISLDSVLVVDNFRSGQLPTKMLLHDNTVLHDLLTVVADPAVTVVYPTLGGLWPIWPPTVPTLPVSCTHTPCPDRFVAF